MPKRSPSGRDNRQLKASGYAGSVCVELSRHSHDALKRTENAFLFLQKLL